MNNKIECEMKPKTYLQRVAATYQKGGMMYRFYSWLDTIRRRCRKNESV